MSFVLKVYEPWPRGPKDENEACLASAEVDENGFLTGGPQTGDEWEDWNAEMAKGHIGRFVMRGMENT